MKYQINGCEFSKHEFVNRFLQSKSYFCKPHHSWEKGIVKNINGLIRRFFPQETNFDIITDRKILYVQDQINSRSMKTLGYKTSSEMYINSTVLLAY